MNERKLEIITEFIKNDSNSTIFVTVDKQGVANTVIYGTTVDIMAMLTGAIKETCLQRGVETDMVLDIMRGLIGNE